jgi:hypothetical protein
LVEIAFYLSCHVLLCAIALRFPLEYSHNRQATGAISANDKIDFRQKACWKRAAGAYSSLHFVANRATARASEGFVFAELSFKIKEFGCYLETIN